VHALLVVASLLAVATFATGLLLPVLARRGAVGQDPERVLADELAAGGAQ
jgi:hypothetical protein